MTIALGILADDGVVIAADTQEGSGYAGGIKVSGRKIYTKIVRAQHRAFSATGAGSAGSLDALHQSLADEFILRVDAIEAQRHIRLKLSEFYRDHILPLQVLAEHERPHVDVLVAMSWKGQKPVLLASEQNVMRSCKDFAAVGAGREHASMLLGRIVPNAHMSVGLAALIAAYTVFHVKEHVEGCGKGTHVTVLSDGNGKYLGEELIGILEYRFHEYLQFDATAVNYMLGRAVIDESESATDLVKILTNIRGTIKNAPHVMLQGGPPFDWAEPDGIAIGDGYIQIKGEALADPPMPSAKPGRKRY